MTCEEIHKFATNSAAETYSSSGDGSGVRFVSVGNICNTEWFKYDRDCLHV